MHDATPVGPVVMVLQVVLIQLFPDVAEVGLQLAIDVGPVVMAAGQVVVVQRFPALAAIALQAPTEMGPVLFGAQEIPT